MLGQWLEPDGAVQVARRKAQGAFAPTASLKIHLVTALELEHSQPSSGVAILGDRLKSRPAAQGLTAPKDEPADPAEVFPWDDS
jgi:hypothetical protein